DFDTAAALLEEEGAEALAHGQLVRGGWLAEFHRRAGRLEQARAWLEDEHTARVADCSPPVVAGWLALDEGTPADAEEHGHAALALAQERDTPWFVLVSLELLASATAQLGSHVESRR